MKIKDITLSIFAIIGFFTIITGFTDNVDINQKGQEGTYQFVIRNAVNNSDRPAFYVFDTRNGDIYMTGVKNGALEDYMLMLDGNLD
ncbi:hypothetical protein N9F15_01840 [Flavobacteriaceae bacterium]|nr:hypothetical protein [Flavobacteriaceae bacterium]